MEKIIKKFLVFYLTIFYLFAQGFYNPLFASVMQSGNYRIESDNSLMPTGGEQSTDNYIFKDTMGEFSSGFSDSTTYKLKAGYQEMQEVVYLFLHLDTGLKSRKNVLIENFQYPVIKIL